MPAEALQTLLDSVRKQQSLVLDVITHANDAVRTAATETAMHKETWRVFSSARDEFDALRDCYKELIEYAVSQCRVSMGSLIPLLHFV